MADITITLTERQARVVSFSLWMLSGQAREAADCLLHIRSTAQQSADGAKLMQDARDAEAARHVIEALLRPKPQDPSTGGAHD